MIPEAPPPAESSQPSPSSPTKEEETVVVDHPQPKPLDEESNAAAPGDRKQRGSTADDDPDGRRSEVTAPRAASGREMSESGVAAAERLRRHRMEMAGRVWIPEMWGQEGMLSEWIDSSVFDRFLVPKGLLSARDALVVEGCTPATGG